MSPLHWPTLLPPVPHSFCPVAGQNHPHPRNESTWPPLHAHSVASEHCWTNHTLSRSSATPFPGQLSPAPLKGHSHLLKSPIFPHLQFLLPSQQMTSLHCTERMSSTSVTDVACASSLGSDWERCLHLLLIKQAGVSPSPSHTQRRSFLDPIHPSSCCSSCPLPSTAGPWEGVWICCPHCPLLLTPQPPPFIQHLAVSTKALPWARSWLGQLFPKSQQ